MRRDVIDDKRSRVLEREGGRMCCSNRDRRNWGQRPGLGSQVATTNGVALGTKARDIFLGKVPSKKEPTSRPEGGR